MARIFTSSRNLAKPLLYIFGLFMLVAIMHSAYLRYNPQRRRELRFPPSPPEAVPLPPVAFLEDLFALVDFLATSADDVTEDGVKVACVAASYAAGWSVVGASDFRLARLSGYSLALMLYTTCDAVSDRAGDAVSLALGQMAATFGVETFPSEPRYLQPVHFIARFADDAVEDSFKILCLWSHSLVGDLLRRNLLSAHGRELLGSLVALGVPAAKYNMCNLYGDFLGDWTQYHLQALIEALEDDDSNPHKLTAAKRSRLRRLRDQLHNGGISLPPTPEPAARVLDTDGGEPGV